MFIKKKQKNKQKPILHNRCFIIMVIIMSIMQDRKSSRTNLWVHMQSWIEAPFLVIEKLAFRWLRLLSCGEI